MSKLFGLILNALDDKDIPNDSPSPFLIPLGNSLTLRAYSSAVSMGDLQETQII